MRYEICESCRFLDAHGVSLSDSICGCWSDDPCEDAELADIADALELVKANSAGGEK